MDDRFAEDIAALAGIKAVPAILATLCRTTGMGFAAVARVTGDKWIACSVRDSLGFGLKPGSELQTGTPNRQETLFGRKPVVIGDFADAADRYGDFVPRIDGLQSYIAMPILLADGEFFGTLCAIDRAPRALNTPETIAMFEMFAEVIGSHLSAIRQLAEERKASALRDQFITVLGHDLRNPLTGILGGMEMLLKNPLNERATQWAHMVVGSAGRMAELIDMVMDFSRSRLGAGLPIKRDAHDSVETVLGQIVAGVQGAAPRQEIQAVLNVPVPIHCDLKRLAQLTSNLLGNALTHGDPGKPIRLTAIAADGRFELSVANAGAPIPEALLPGIFEPFSRGSAQSGGDGLGLGLYVSHQIALAHDGNLVASSTAEETRFTFNMPIAARSV